MVEPSCKSGFAVELLFCLAVSRLRHPPIILHRGLSPSRSVTKGLSGCCSVEVTMRTVFDSVSSSRFIVFFFGRASSPAFGVKRDAGHRHAVQLGTSVLAHHAFF